MAASTVEPASASKPSPGPRSALLARGCPPAPLVANPVQEAARAAALEGRFDVFASLSAKLVPPVNWRRDDYRSKQWRRALQQLRWLDPLLGSYEQSGDVGALRRARDLVLDWAMADARGKVPRGAWVDKIGGDRADYVAYVARAAACEGILRRAAAGKFVASIRMHGSFLARRVKYRPTNHGLFVDMGLARLADQVPSLPAADRWRAVAKRRFERTLRGRLDVREGVWREHSTAYQLTVTQLAEKFVARVGYAHTPGYLERMREATRWFVMPDGRLTQIGDTDLKDAPAWAGDRGGEVHGLRSMKRSGYAVVSEPQSHLAVGASFFNGSHKHSDDLSFQLFEDGHRVVSDGGKFHGDQDRTRRFALSSPAHSVLTADGKSFPRETEDAYGSGILAAGTGDGWYAILAHNPLLREQGVRHVRLFLYRPSKLLAIVDRVRASRPHRYQRYFQLGPEIGVEASGTTARLTADGFGGALTDAPSRRGFARRTAARGQERPLRGWTFPSFRRWVPRWTLSFESKGEDLDHVATFDLDGADSTATLLGGGASRIEVRNGAAAPQQVTVTRQGPVLRVSSGASAPNASP